MDAVGTTMNDWDVKANTTTMTTEKLTTDGFEGRCEGVPEATVSGPLHIDWP